MRLFGMSAVLVGSVILSAACGPAYPPNAKNAEQDQARLGMGTIPEQDLGAFDAVPTETKRIMPFKGDKRERTRKMAIHTATRDQKRELSWFEEVLAAKKEGGVSKLRVIISSDQVTTTKHEPPAPPPAEGPAPAPKPPEVTTVPGALDGKGATFVEKEGAVWATVDDRGRPDTSDDAKAMLDAFGRRDDFDPVVEHLDFKLLNPGDVAPELVPSVNDLVRRRTLEGARIDDVNVIYRGVRQEIMVFEVTLVLATQAPDAAIARLKGGLFVDRTTGTTVAFKIGGLLEAARNPGDPMPPPGEFHFSEETVRNVKKK